MAKKFSDGKIGSAMTIRVTPRADTNEVVEILSDETVKIRLNCSPDENEINALLLEFLSHKLNIPKNKLEIVAGHSGRDKLVSILNLNTQQLQRKVSALIK